MALQRRLLLAVLTLGSLLCIYVLCLKLEWPHTRAPAWSTGALSRFYGPTEGGSRDSKDELPPPPPPPPPPPDTERPPASTPLPHPAARAGASNGLAAAAPPDDVPKAVESGPGPRGPTAPAPTGPPKPSEADFIGDAYSSEDFPPRTGCLGSVWRRVGVTPFAGRFLPSVPVLQWSKHATAAEHRRLSRYPGAHGWGGIDYTTLVASLSVLNSTSNRQMLDDWETRRGGAAACSRCAVVGNGGILKGSGKGAEIDGHHYVFRTNGAIIQGFEQDVGSRTTHYTFSTNTLMNSMRSYAGAGYKGPPVSQETRYVFLPDHDRDYLLMEAAATHTVVPRGPEKGKQPWQYFGDDVSVEKLKMYHPDFIRYLRNRFLRSNTLNTKYRNIYRPSTGAAMLLAALHTCDQVSAYGFITPDYTNYSDHYYDSSFHPVGFFINHDLRMELQLWQQLEEAQLLQLYMRQ